MRIRSLSKYLLAVFLSFPVFAEDWIPQVIGPFGTLNNRDSSYAIGADKAQDLLNVNITEGGKSVVKRKGYGTAFTLSVTTSPVHGVYTFFDSNGNTIDLYFNDTRMSASVSGASPTVVFSTGPVGATYQCTDSLGFAYCANTSRTTLVKTNGVTYSNISSVSSTGTMVATCVTRLAMAGFASTPSRIDFSADSDFTTWGSGSLGTSAAQFTINAPGAKITHIVYAFGRLMWFKDSSFGYILIGNQPAQSDWVIKTVSFDVGTNDNTSIYREGLLYFRGQDGHIYEFDGSNYRRLSREIAGTIALSQLRISNAWTQTSQSDFQDGSTNPGGWVSTSVVSGSLVLATQTANSPFVDHVSTNFALGSFVTTSTRTANSVRLSFVTDSLARDFYPGGGAAICTTNACSNPYFQSYAFWVPAGSFQPSNTLMSSVVIRVKKVGSPTNNYNMILKSDSSGVPGATIETIAMDVSSVGSSAQDFTVAFSSTSRLLSGTTYWLQLAPDGTCDSSNQIQWLGTSGTSNSFTKCGASNTGSLYAFRASTTAYSSSGIFTSNSFDMGFTTATWLWSWSNFYATSTLPSNTGLAYRIQTSSDNVSSSPLWTTAASITSGGISTAPVQQYIRYVATFTTSDVSTSPALTYAQINMSNMLRPGGTFYSAVKNAPNLTGWDSFQPSFQVNGGTIAFAIRSSTNPITVTSSTPSWTTFTSGSIPTISTGTYFQIRSQISVSSYGALTSVVGPKLDDFTQNWLEGNATDKMYATYFDDKLWFSVTYGTGATTNNRDLIYDLVSGGWVMYDIPTNGFLVRRNQLYFGSTTGGTIFKFGDTENDNGSAINAYWKSKDFFGANPFTQQEITNISLISKSVANSSMTVTYSLNGSSSTSFSVPQYGGNYSFSQKNKNIPSGVSAYQYNIKFGNNAADQPFEVFGVQVGIRPKSWVPN